MNEFVEKNHYVPESYLKRWGDANGKISVYRILVPNQNVPLWKKASPRGLANHRHLYTRIITSEESDEIERWFNTEFESPAAASIEKAVSDNQLSPEDWKNLIRFLAAQDVRTPTSLIKTLQNGQSNLESVINENALRTYVQDYEKLKEQGISPIISPNSNAEFLPIKVSTELLPGADFGTLRVEGVVGRGYWLFTIKSALTGAINKLLTHKWTILRSPAGFEWATSDDPVIRLNYHNPEKYDFFGGWDSAGTEIFLPLSPRHLLYTKIGSKPLKRGTVLSIELSRGIQQIIIEHAHRFVFTSKQDANVSVLRPRKVDATIFANEAEQWRNWHEKNKDAESDLR